MPVNLISIINSTAMSFASGGNNITINIGNYTIPNTGNVYIYYTMVIPIQNPLGDLPVQVTQVSSIVSSILSLFG
jgi:cadmium resistance protein CadD (predicted permease)